MAASFLIAQTVRPSDGSPRDGTLEVQDRFNALLQALGAEFDGEIEGINLQETAIEVTNELDATFSPEGLCRIH